ncbi:L-histidine N(alpha)-methyltransferase [Aquiflexum lacus]|uniref:L-histidine N(alpha)-methyltransferase n=1 Tax=Aquiflexum lacus TaxID=2483805 RepID=UPI001895B1C8|nr:L-histidine N(alpha)-methyltransferase [Aquiflexum lacus]
MGSDSFINDVIWGLSDPQKHLPSKYFYDEKGSRIFQEIMQMEEYYLPKCEMEILNKQSQKIAMEINHDEFDIIELGAGDGTKTLIFLEAVMNIGKKITYIPMDISEEILKVNRQHILERLPDLSVEVLPGDYFSTIRAIESRPKPRLVMFMGSNIGNFPGEKAIEFIRFVNDYLNPGDYFLMGVDLKKNPHVIRAAYNDKKGITKKFNLNLLERINRELQGDFNLKAFEHYGVYNPLDGAALSFLVSMEEQDVHIADHTFHFDQYETIHTEVSQKYSLKDLDQLAIKTGFSWDRHFTDRMGFYSLSLFRK